MKSINLIFAIASVLFLSLITLVVYNAMTYGIYLPVDLFNYSI